MITRGANEEWEGWAVHCDSCYTPHYVEGLVVEEHRERLAYGWRQAEARRARGMAEVLMVLASKTPVTAEEAARDILSAVEGWSVSDGEDRCPRCRELRRRG